MWRNFENQLLAFPKLKGMLLALLLQGLRSRSRLTSESGQTLSVLLVLSVPAWLVMLAASRPASSSRSLTIYVWVSGLNNLVMDQGGESYCLWQAHALVFPVSSSQTT